MGLAKVNPKVDSKVITNNLPNSPSVSVSSSEAASFSSSEEPTSRLVVRRRVGIFDELWTQFVAKCRERQVLPSSDDEWENRAPGAWNALNPGQKQAALLDVSSRAADDPVCRMRVCNYLNGKEWTRPEMRPPRAIGGNLNSGIARIAALRKGVRNP